MEVKLMKHRNILWHNARWWDAGTKFGHVKVPDCCLPPCVFLMIDMLNLFFIFLVQNPLLDRLAIIKLRG
jgi:hypothetical protein